MHLISPARYVSTTLNTDHNGREYDMYKKCYRIVDKKHTFHTNVTIMTISVYERSKQKLITKLCYINCKINR